MKNRKNIFAALAACVAMVFASCSNLTDANVSSTTENRNPLNVEITNYDDILTDVSLQANTGSRTIIPESFDSTGVLFYIFGTNIGGGKLAPTEVTFTAGANSKVGKVDIPADSNIWDFTLIAVPKKDPATVINESTALDEAVLIGYDTVDMINGDVAKFTLAPDGLTKAGSVAMKLYTDGWDLPDGYYAKAGIYLLTTGADATKAGDGSGAATEKEYPDAAALSNAAPVAANFEVNSMTPGTYLFKVTFTKENKNFYWSDVIVVLPGKQIENTIGIPNVIGELPAAPNNFTAALVTGSEDKYYDSYVTEFAWERGSKNENYFEIDLLELADDTDALPDNNTWDTAAGKIGAVSTTYGMNFAESDIHESGTLMGGSTSVQAILKLGKRYAARIRAVNDAGASATYAYVGLSPSPVAPGTEAFDSSTINRFRINYVLQGGTLDPDGNEAKAAITTDVYPVYLSQDKSTGNPIIEPSGDGSDATPALTKDTNKWGYWRTGTGTKCDTNWDTNYPNYTGYKNLDLYAVFTSTADVEIFDLSTLDIKSTWITLDTGTLTGKTASIEAAGTPGEEATWTFTAADINDVNGDPIADFTYDRVCFTVTAGSMYRYAESADNVPVGEDKVFTLPLEGLRGIYQVQFVAIKGNYTYTYTITLTVNR